MFKRYIKTVFVLFFLGISCSLFSQNVGINISGATPSQNAILDLNTGNSNNLGFVIPNVNLVGMTTWTAPMAYPCTGQDSGMFVFNTNAAVGNGVGYYYWNRTASTWVSLLGVGSFSTCAGALSGYIPYFISTTEICNSLIYQSGPTTTGVNTTTPQNMLDVNGAVAIGSYAGSNSAPANSMIVSGQVGIGNNSPNASAALDLTNAANNLGMLAPRLTAVQIGAMTYPVAIGLIVYNITTGCLEFNSTGTSTGWNDIMCPCVGAPATPGNIVGDQTICASASYTYSVAAVAGAGSYTWSVPANIGSISSGQGTNTITITTPNSVYGVGNAADFNTITVTASNACGTSAASTYGVQVVPDHGSEIFNFQAAVNLTWQAPPCVTQVTVQLWGEGGGGSYGCCTYYSSSGSGGYVSGTMTVTPLTTYTIVVGQGGVYGQQNPYGVMWGGGGFGGNATSQFCGEGGGRSAIQVVSGTDYVTAGGGGGAGLGYNSVGTLTIGYGSGGAGGANTGGTAGTDFTATLATGGTQVAGGTTGNYLGWVGTNGVYQTGGKGGTKSLYGGGGGGGYYGGGGGSGDIGGGGGGGSNYVTNLTGVVTNLQGNSSAVCNCAQINNPPNTGDPNYTQGVGVGGYNTSEAFCGGQGEVIITW